VRRPVTVEPEHWLNSNKGTKCEIRFHLRPFRPWSGGIFATPKNVPLWSASFGGLIPTVSCSFSSEKSYSPSRLMCCQEPPSRWPQHPGTLLEWRCPRCLPASATGVGGRPSRSRWIGSSMCTASRGSAGVSPGGKRRPGDGRSLQAAHQEGCLAAPQPLASMISGQKSCGTASGSGSQNWG